MSDLAKTTIAKPARETVAEQYVVRGPVQGIGLRPAVARCAIGLGLAGEMRNTNDGVTVEVAGDAAQACDFAAALATLLPVQSQVARRATAPSATRGFHIVESCTAGPLAAQVPVDVAICNDCLAEVTSPDNRRYGYSLITCATCGPRYSMIESMPYDRASTSMRAYPLCDSCGAEYRFASDRRFHAESIACQHCGPAVWAADRAGAVLAADGPAP